MTPKIFCRACSSALVQASDWARCGADGWQVRVWCPECGFEHRAVLGRSEVSFLAHAIEDGFASVLEALAELITDSESGPQGLCILTRLNYERVASADA